MHTKWDARALERIGETEVGGRIVGRISTQHDQKIYLAAPHVGNQVLQRLGLIHRVGVHRVGVENRLAYVTLALIEGMGQRVDSGWLVIAGNNDARPRMVSDVLAKGLEESSPLFTGTIAAQVFRLPSRNFKQLLGNSRCEVFDIDGFHRQPMVRLCTRRTRRALDHVKPAHVAGIGIAPLRKISRVAREAGESRVEEIAVERENYVRVFQLVLRLHRLPERQLRAFEHVVAVCRLIDMPLRLGINLQQRTQLVSEGGRGDSRGQDADARSQQALLDIERGTHGLYQRSPGANFPEVGERLRTIGVIHTQDRSLREDICPAQTRRMPVIAFNLGGTIKMTLDQDRAGVSAERECSGKK